MDRGAWQATVHRVERELDMSEHACIQHSGQGGRELVIDPPADLRSGFTKETQ